MLLKIKKPGTRPGFYLKKIFRKVRAQKVDTNLVSTYLKTKHRGVICILIF